MPSTITHSFFALDVCEKLDKNITKLIDKDLLKVTAQWTDFFVMNLKEGEVLRDITHLTKSKLFFITLIKYIKEHNLTKNKDIMTMLYGFICHYALDTVTHPFIVYKSGFYEKNNKNTLKYIGIHGDMETAIDAYFIFQKFGIKPNKFKIHQYNFKINDFSKEFKKTIRDVFNQVYHLEEIDLFYLKTYKRAKMLYYLLRYDRLGIKKKLYKLINKLSRNKIMVFEFFSYHVDPKRKEHYLNKEKEKWNHPLDDREEYNLSFIELYIIALNKAVNIISTVNEVLKDEVKENALDELFDDSSYLSGKPSSLGHEFKYFEF